LSNVWKEQESDIQKMHEGEAAHGATHSRAIQKPMHGEWGRSCAIYFPSGVDLITWNTCRRRITLASRIVPHMIHQYSCGKSPVLDLLGVI